MSRKKKNTAKNDTAFKPASNKHKTCKHVISNGSFAVYVDTECKQAHMIKGILVCTPAECRNCEYYEGRENV